MNDEQIARECEARFQSGSTRTQIVNARGQVYRAADSAKQARHMIDEGDRIFARRKVRLERRYAWVCVK